jgi:sugar phosphate permease
MSKSPPPLRLFLIFLTLSALYFFSMFYRFSNAVISPNLVKDLGLNAETLGILGGAFFYSFTLLQIPMGPMLDRVGPRIVVSVSSFIGALGAFLFAFGNSFFMVFFGRILIGVGMSSVLMGSMKVFVLYFPQERFATLVGILLSVGMFGTIFAASPLAYFTSAIGWRTMFMLAGAGTILLTLLVFRALDVEKRVDGESVSPSGSEAGVFQSIRLILKSPIFWQLGVVAFFRYGTISSLQGLWLAHYLISAKGYSPVQTGNFIILLAIGAIVGGPVAGQLSDRVLHSRKGLVLVGLGLYAVCLFPLAGVVHIQNPLCYGILFFFIGFFNNFGMLIYAHAKEMFPTAILGTVITFVNFFTMAGGAIFMPVLGRLIESFPRSGNSYPAEAYHLAFLICFLGMTVSLVFYAFSKSESPLHSEGKVIRPP